MPRKAKESTYKGSIINIKSFEAQIAAMQEEYQLSRETIINLLIASIDKAYRDTHYSTKQIELKNTKGKIVSHIPSEASSVHSETIIEKKTGNIIFYECKDVVPEDELEDDVYQIDPEEANELDPSKTYAVGDVFKIAHPIDTSSASFLQRLTQYFTAKIKESIKQHLNEKYSERIGNIIQGVIESSDGKYTYLIVNKTNAVLTPRDIIPGETFMVGQTVKVLLNGIGTSESKTGEKTTTLQVTRSSDLFLQRLFEQEIPDLMDGTVKIEKIVREAGLRSKIAVSATGDSNVIPTGAFIGSDGSRIKDIVKEIGGNEKIDVVQYSPNKYIFIAEALKPANVVGVVINENQEVAPNKLPKAIAIVKNEESRIAIGKGGINVRLASRLTGYSIDIKELDAALAEHISYTSIDELRRNEALDRLAKEAENIPTLEEDEEDNEFAEKYVLNNSPELQVKPQESPKVEETNQPEIKEEKPIKDEEVEHVEITSKAKVSLSELEAQIAEEKKKKPTEAKKYKKDDKKKEEKSTEKKKPVISNAMPIYTEEELKAIEEEEEQALQEEEDQADYEEEYGDYDL